MDGLDFAIYRYMFPGGEGRFWGSRSIIDPRITPHEIGDRVGLSEVAVRTRIAKLRDEGLFLGYDVWPNPRLFGASQMVLELTARDTQHADRILRSLPRIHGVIAARVMIDEDARRVRISFVNDTPERTDRRTREILRLSDMPANSPILPEWLPPCTRTMRPIDWRIVSALRKAPELGLGDHARRLGLTSKTVGQRFHALLDSGAIFWTLHVDYALFPVATCFLDLKNPSLRDSVWREVESRGLLWLPSAAGGLGEPPHPPAPWISAKFWMPAPAAMDGLTRELMTIPGVRSVRRRFPSTAVDVPTWFDEQLGTQLTSSQRIEQGAHLEALPIS